MATATMSVWEPTADPEPRPDGNGNGAPRQPPVTYLTLIKRHTCFTLFKKMPLQTLTKNKSLFLI